jgi:spore germination protein
MIIHVVKPGDSVYSIARQYGASPQKIISDNELANPEQLVIGQTLVVLEGERRHTVQPGDSIYKIARRYNTTAAEIIQANPDLTDPSSLQVGQV